MTRRLRLLIVGLIVPLAAACSDSTAPGTRTPDEQAPSPDTPSLTGRYVLSGAAGATLPALVNRSVDSTTGDVIDVYVTSDTLEVMAEGRYVQRAHLEARIGTLVVGRSSWVDRGRLTIGSDALAFASEYIQNVSFTGRRESTGGIRVHQDLAQEGTVVEYTFTRLP